MSGQKTENMPNEEKIIDPKMQFNAFMANVKDGGLRSVSSVYLLICYIVANMNGKVTQDTIMQAIEQEMIANRFEVSDAMTKLLKAGTIAIDETGMLVITDNDIDSIELIEKDLPFSIRQKSIKACQKVLAKEQYKRENKASIEETDKGFIVHLTVSDNEYDFMKLDLYAASKEQATIIKDKFFENPVAIYDKLIDSIFDNE